MFGTFSAVLPLLLPLFLLSFLPLPLSVRAWYIPEMTYTTGPCNVTECVAVIDGSACLAARLPTRDPDLVFGCVEGGAESVCRRSLFSFFSFLHFSFF